MDDEKVVLQICLLRFSVNIFVLDKIKWLTDRRAIVQNYHLQVSSRQRREWAQTETLCGARNVENIETGDFIARKKIA